MSHRTNPGWAVLALAAWLAGRESISGQASQAIHVSFRFKALEFAQALPSSERAVAEAAIAERSATHLLEKVPYWSFSSSAEDPPLLIIWLQKGHPDWEIRMSLRTAAGERGPWKAKLFAPGDLEALGGLPSPSRWPDTILAAFRDGLMTEHSPEVLATLEELIPLGRQVVPLGPQPPANPDQARAILPLKWEKYCSFAASEFRIVYQWTGGGEVVLHSSGISMPFDYTPDQPAFRGMVVIHQFWESANQSVPIAERLPRLSELQPLAFYLVKPIYRSTPCDQPGPNAAATVAP